MIRDRRTEFPSFLYFDVSDLLMKTAWMDAASWQISTQSLEVSPPGTPRSILSSISISNILTVLKLDICSWTQLQHHLTRHHLLQHHQRLEYSLCHRPLIRATSTTIMFCLITFLFLLLPTSSQVQERNQQQRSEVSELICTGIN